MKRYHLRSSSYKISYTHITTKILNYKKALHDLNIDDFKSKPPDCTCWSSPFIHNPADHVITVDLNSINNTSTEMFAKGLKYREPKSVPTFDYTLFEYCNN